MATCNNQVKYLNCTVLSESYHTLSSKHQPLQHVSKLAQGHSHEQDLSRVHQHVFSGVCCLFRCVLLYLESTYKI